MTSPFDRYRSTEAPLPRKTWAWNMYGPGLEHIGREGRPELFDVPETGYDQLLVRVDAVGMCFSDVKLIQQGGKHPKLYNRDLAVQPTRLGHEAALTIIRVGKESRAGYPALADEFDMVAQEVKAGKERISVLKDMAERVGVPDVASFVTTIIQSATFGTSIADALRVYSADMRDKRIMRAEEKANMLPTKLTLGTMMFTVPPLLVILIGPSVYGMVTMLTQLAGGL